MIELITGGDNPKIKMLASLHKRQGRKKQGLFLAEGIRLAETVATSSWNIFCGLFTPDLQNSPRGQKLLRLLHERNCPLYETTPQNLQKVSEVDTPQGIILAVQQAKTDLAVLAELKNPLLIVLDRVQDPGNVGTIIRTADAAGADGIITLQGTADIFAGKTVRSTMGSLFHLPICHDVRAENLGQFLRATNLCAYAALLNPQSKPFFAAPLNPAALIFGNEGSGISPEILPYCQAVHIPMFGQAESLNVSTAASIIIYEAARQRHKI